MEPAEVDPVEPAEVDPVEPEEPVVVEPEMLVVVALLFPHAAANPARAMRPITARMISPFRPSFLVIFASFC